MLSCSRDRPKIRRVWLPVVLVGRPAELERCGQERAVISAEALSFFSAFVILPIHCPCGIAGAIQVPKVGNVHRYRRARATFTGLPLLLELAKGASHQIGRKKCAIEHFENRSRQ